MTKWQDYFKIEDEWYEDDDFMLSGLRYKIIIISTEEVVGTYKDYEYAEKQARFKFKKLIKKIDKILLD